MGQLDDSIREMVKRACEITATETVNFPKPVNLAEDPEFQDDYIDHCMESVGLVFCVTCQRMIDDEKHDIKHVFAHNAREIREKSVLERMAGNIIEEKDAY